MRRAIGIKGLLAMAMAMAMAAVPAMAQIGVYIGPTPPPLRYEERPPLPAPGYVWNDGYWNWAGGRYAWVGGRWVAPPFSGAYWNHPYYDHYDRGWEYHPGHWGHDDPGFHHDWGRGRR